MVESRSRYCSEDGKNRGSMETNDGRSEVSIVINVEKNFTVNVCNFTCVKLTCQHCLNR